MIKAVIFDFAGVIGTEAFYRWTEKNDPNRLEDKPYYSSLADQVDEGSISKDQFVETLSKRLHIPKEEIWPGVRAEVKINLEMIELIKKLRKHYKIGMISNYLYEWLEKIIEENKLAQYFDQIIISSKIGIKKPDPRIFNMALDEFKIAPEEAVFIDDRDYQVEGAKAVGMNAFIFSGVEDLKEDLKNLNVSID